MEAPDISKQRYKFPETDYTTVEFLALEIMTSDEAKRFLSCLWPSFASNDVTFIQIETFSEKLPLGT